MLMRGKRTHLGLIGLAAVATGCVPALLTGRVSAALYSPPPSRATFTIVGSDVQGLSLSERRIQTLLAEQMTNLGFALAQNRASTDLAVQYSYNVGAGTTQVSSSPDFVLGGQKVDSHTEYPRFFQVAIVDVKASTLPDKVTVLWQGELYSTGSSADIGVLSSYFITEIFRSFGKSETNRRFSRIMR